MWYAIAILIFASTPPTLFQTYEARAMPVPYATKQQCEDGIVWLAANTPKLPTPTPDTRVVYACVQA